MAKDPAKNKPTTAFKVGAISLVFLIIGYQAALFVHKAAVLGLIAHRDAPDTVYVYLSAEDSTAFASLAKTASSSAPVSSSSSLSNSSSANYSARGEVLKTERRASAHSPEALQAYREFAPRRYESFPFNPNTASPEDLQRLGFSEKQASSIIKYREAGGRFRRKEDFAKSFVVADSVYRRLESFIEIPLLDINKADSAAFDSLPGIGGYFASKMVSYRSELGGYSFPEQLMDIYHFDRDKFEALRDLIVCDPADARPFALWTLPADSLRLHPYVRGWNTARAIILYRENTPANELSVQGLADAGIIPPETAAKLSRCRLVPAP